MKQDSRPPAAFLLPLVVALVLFSSTSPTAQSGAQPPSPERFTAHEIMVSPMGSPPRSDVRLFVRPVQVGIDRWSTEAERKEVTTAFVRGGQKAVARVLEKIKRSVGYIYLPHPGAESDEGGPPRLTLKYAWQMRAENGGRRIVLAMPAPGSDGATVYEMRFAPNGTGEGRTGVIGVSKDGTTIDLTVYEDARVCWTDVRKR